MAYTKPKKLSHSDLPVDGASQPGAFERSVLKKQTKHMFGPLPRRKIPKLADPTGPAVKKALKRRK